MRIYQLLLVLICCFALSSNSFSQVAHPAETANLAKQSQNPIANLISVPFQNNINFGMGLTTVPKICY